VLCVLCGAGAVETVDENQVFACWLQKKSGDYGLFERAVFG